MDDQLYVFKLIMDINLICTKFVKTMYREFKKKNNIKIT